MARISKESLLSQDQLWHEVFNGSWSHRWVALLRETMEVFVRGHMASALPQRLGAALFVGEARMQSAVQTVRMAMYTTSMFCVKQWA